MKSQQHAILVRHNDSATAGLSDLNVRLQRGWQVVSVTPLGGSINNDEGCLAALVIIERESSEEASISTLEEEKPQEVIEGISEKAGPGQEISEELEDDTNGEESPSIQSEDRD